jgi:hypothetical protein
MVKVVNPIYGMLSLNVKNLSTNKHLSSKPNNINYYIDNSLLYLHLPSFWQPPHNFHSRLGLLWKNLTAKKTLRYELLVELELQHQFSDSNVNNSAAGLFESNTHLRATEMQWPMLPSVPCTRAIVG